MPSRMARNMRSGKSYAIGVVSFFEAGNAVFAPMLRAVTEASRACGYTAVVCLGAEDLSYIDAYKKREVDGFIIIAPAAARFNERAHIRALHEAEAPFAIVNGSIYMQDVASVLLDYGAVSKAAVEHFVSLGYSRIVYVDEFSEEAARELRERREGYMDAMREAGLLPRTCDLARFDADDLSGAEAIVVSRAPTARALMRLLLDDGVRIPQAYELIAGSGEAEERGDSLPLTAYEFSYAQAGEYAVRAVLGMIPAVPFSPSPVYTAGKTARDRAK